MRFIVHSGTDNKETPERYDSAGLALEAVSAFSAAETPRRQNFRRRRSARQSLPELQALAVIENKSDNA